MQVVVHDPAVRTGLLQGRHDLGVQVAADALVAGADQKLQDVTGTAHERQPADPNPRSVDLQQHREHVISSLGV